MHQIIKLGYVLRIKHRIDKMQYLKQLSRSLATIPELFPNKTDFPTRHIGPRKTDVVMMLELLGLKV